MKIYISGAITNNENFKEEFEDTESLLIGLGHKVMNPASLPEGFSQKDYMDICISMINSCDAIYMIKGWKESEGAKIEKAYAEKIGLKVFDRVV